MARQFLKTARLGIARTSAMGLSSSALREEITAHPVVVYSTTRCPFCVKAKKLLTEEGIEYHTVDLDRQQNGREVAGHLKDTTGWRTVPQIFVCGKFIGGYDELRGLHSSDQLLRRVQECSLADHPGHPRASL